MAGLAPLTIRRFLNQRTNKAQTARKVDLENTRDAARLTLQLIQTQNHDLQRTRAVLEETGRAKFTVQDSVRWIYVK